jgi:hypothetical protein
MSVEKEFRTRAGNTQWLGLGLSVDLYNPNLFELVQTLRDNGLPFGYLEIFKASEAGLQEVKRRLPHVPFASHGEGLWLTQPDFLERSQTEFELDAAIAQLNILGCHWFTHECASKQMAGYSVGTYLPPLFTRRAAEVVAENARYIQARLDRDSVTAASQAPLLLLELPPWTYFGAGDLDVPAFFGVIAEQAPCGFVLDIGHLWTVYRYSAACRSWSLRDCVARFLDGFPMDRVIQIHLAGLALHEHIQGPSDPPLWIDAHGAPIPSLLFEMLEQVLASERLTNLKGLALEVDTKDISLIAQEFGRFRAKFGGWRPAMAPDGILDDASASPRRRADVTCAVTASARAQLQADYRWYAATAAGVETGVAVASSFAQGLDRTMLALYREVYLPHEILRWGGDLRTMFPETCGLLDGAEVPLDRFVSYWFREPRVSDAPYDFFLLKIDRFVGFIREVLPWAQEVTVREAADLHVAYQLACENVGHESLVNGQRQDVEKVCRQESLSDER